MRFLLAVLLTGVGFLAGCEAVPAANLFSNKQQRDEQSRLLVRQAVADLTSGAATAARGRIDTAVALRGGDGVAKTLVAIELMELGRPEAAERLLLPFLSLPGATTLPALGWGVLATAAAKRGDTEAELQARERAMVQAKSVAARFGERPTSEIDRARRIRELLDLAKFHGLPPADGKAVVAACREAVAVARQSPVALSRLARALADYADSDADRDSAVDTALEAIQFQREQKGNAIASAELRDAYGWALLRRGRGDDSQAALRVLGDAVEDQPENPELRLHFGMALAAGGQQERALVEIERALLLRPDYPAAQLAKQELGEAGRSDPTERR